jgi:hypothetical protein
VLYTWSITARPNTVTANNAQAGAGMVDLLCVARLVGVDVMVTVTVDLVEGDDGGSAVLTALLLPSLLSVAITVAVAGAVRA